MPKIKPLAHPMTPSRLIGRAKPHLITRVADPSTPDEALTSVERAVRVRRTELLAELGESPSASAVALLNALVGTMIVLDSIDAKLFELAEDPGLVNNAGEVLHVTEARTRVASALARQLVAFEALKPPTRKPLTAIELMRQEPSA